jgi:hypothetical protein
MVGHKMKFESGEQTTKCDNGGSALVGQHVVVPTSGSATADSNDYDGKKEPTADIGNETIPRRNLQFFSSSKRDEVEGRRERMGRGGGLILLHPGHKDKDEQGEVVEDCCHEELRDHEDDDRGLLLPKPTAEKIDFRKPLSNFGGRKAGKGEEMAEQRQRQRGKWLGVAVLVGFLGVAALSTFFSFPPLSNLIKYINHGQKILVINHII